MEPIQKAIAARRWPEAERRLVDWIASHPDDGNARVMLAVLLLGRRNEGEARETLLAVREGDPARSRAQGLLGEMALQGRRAAEAERAFRDAAARDPKAAEPRRKLVYLLSLQQRTGEVRDLLWELYAIGRDPRLLIDLVMELWAFENDARSPGSELNEFLARTPDDPYLRRARGLSLLLGGKAAEALPDLEASAVSLADDPVGRFALAECRMTLGTFQGDESILGPRPAAPADTARWWVLRGRLQELLGRPNDAVGSFREAVASNPDDVEAQYRLGRALVQAGSKAEGQSHLDRSEELRRRQGEVRREHANLRRQGFEADAALFERFAQLCLDINLAAEARAWLELAVRADPGRPSARASLAGLADDRRPFPFPLSHPRLGSKSELLAPGPASVAGTRPAAEPRFEEVASRSGIPFRYESGAKGDLFLGDTMGGGVGLIDYDGDGWLDVYFVNGCPMPYDPASPPRPNRLYRNLGDGTFEDVTEKAGVPGRGDGMGCAVADYDNDGDDDLFVTGLGSTVLYRNRGDGTFEDVTAQAGVASDRWTTAAGFGDLDADGDLDLVVVTYVAADPKDSPACRDHSGGQIHCSPSLFPAQPDHLFRNNGDGTFTDVAAEAGFDGPEGRGLGLAIADLDEDGRLDIFVANDASPCFAFRNLGGLKFEEVGMTSGLALNGSGKPTAAMGVVADDLDGDGRLDIFVTNFLNEPNTLFRGLGGGIFSDATTAANLHAPSIPMTGFGTAALDVDRDGILDLFVANGHVDDQPWVNSPMAQLPHLFLGRGGGRFDLSSPECPELRKPTVGRGVAAGDLDNDGRMDLVVINRDAPAYLLRNTTEGGHWLGLRLVGSRSGRTPVGARVTCNAGGRAQVHWVTSGTSYLSVNDPRIWFGLGSQARVESLEIRWPSGAVQTWKDLPADRILEVREGRDPEHIGRR
jgi:tetratricopeptide (TPR) repeat protein